MILSTESAEKDGKTLSWHALAVAERSIREEHSDSKAPVADGEDVTIPSLATICLHLFAGEPKRIFVAGTVIRTEVVRIIQCQRCRSWFKLNPIEVVNG